MNSMTGFGKGTFNLAKQPMSVELRSLNHRFLDIRVRMPWFDAELEALIQARVRARLARGRVDLVVAEQRGSGGIDELRLNKPLARRLGQLAEELAQELGVDRASALQLLPSRGDLVVAASAPVAGAISAEVAWEAVRPGVDAALDELSRMRAKEGESHRGALQGHLARLRQLAVDIGRHAAGQPDRLRERMERRLARLTGDDGGVAVDPVRLAQEVALLADRADVTEEMDRLESHFKQLEGLLSSGTEGPLGRKLEFMQQELLREFNTTGSKTQDPEVSHLVVDAKSTLEKVRELIQNVE